MKGLIVFSLVKNVFLIKLFSLNFDLHNIANLFFYYYSIVIKINLVPFESLSVETLVYKSIIMNNMLCSLRYVIVLEKKHQMRYTSNV